MQKYYNLAEKSDMVSDFLTHVEGALSYIHVKYPDWVLDKEANTLMQSQVCNGCCPALWASLRALMLNQTRPLRDLVKEAHLIEDEDLLEMVSLTTSKGAQLLEERGIPNEGCRDESSSCDTVQEQWNAATQQL